MATATAERTGVLTGNWKAGVGGGAAGALAMGALVLAMKAETLAVAIPSLYGLVLGGVYAALGESI